MDENELFRRYRETGDVALRNEIVENNLHIASILAKKFVGRGVEYDDLFQVASLALIKGVERFDPAMGLKFSTFITPTIAGEIKNYFRDRSRLVHLPRKVSELRASVKKAAEELLAETGKKPTAGEIAERLHVDEEEVLRAEEAGSVVSLDRPAEGTDGLSFYEILPSEGDEYEGVENREAVAAALKSLSVREREVVSYRFGHELSQAETAKKLGVSQMYISRMERKILEKLRENLGKSVAE